MANNPAEVLSLPSVAAYKALGRAALIYKFVRIASYWGDGYGPELSYEFIVPAPAGLVPDDGFAIVATGLASDGSEGCAVLLPTDRMPPIDAWGVSPGQTAAINSPRLQKALNFLRSAYNVTTVTLPTFGSIATFQYRYLGILGGTYDCSAACYDITNNEKYPEFIPGWGLKGVARVGNLGASTLLVGSQTENYPGLDACGVGGFVIEDVSLVMVSSGDQPAFISGNINNNDGTFTANGNVTFSGGSALTTNNSYTAVAIQDGDILCFANRWTGGGGAHKGRSAVSAGKIWEELYGPTIGSGSVGADASTGNLLTLGSGASAVDGFYIGRQAIVMWNGASTFSDIDTYRITAYNGTTKVCTLDHALYNPVTIVTSRISIPIATSKYAYLTTASNGATYIDLGNASFQAPQAFVWNGGQICKGDGNYFSSIANSNYSPGDAFTINPYFTNSTYNELDLRNLDFEEYVTDPSKPIAIVKCKAIASIKLSGNSRLHVTASNHLRGVIESLSTDALADVRNIQLSGLLSGDDLLPTSGAALFNITQPNPVKKISGEIMATTLGTITNGFNYYDLTFLNLPALTQQITSGQFSGSATLRPALTTNITTGGSSQVRFQWAFGTGIFNPANFPNGPVLALTIGAKNTGGSTDTLVVAYNQGAGDVSGSSYAVAAGNTVKISVLLTPITGGMREVVVYQDSAGQSVSTTDYTGGNVINPAMNFSFEIKESQASSSSTTGLVLDIASFQRSG